jgi:hypothetical protein
MKEFSWCNLLNLLKISFGVVGRKIASFFLIGDKIPASFGKYL